jgi:AcrR family transcriptional regulator
MADAVTTLFDEYAQRFARGERPDVREYLARAGEGAEELSRMIDGYLTRVPPPEPDEASRTLAAAWLQGRTPLVELRVRRGLKRDAVVDALIERLGLDAAKREKVKRRYHELENGLLDPGGVDRSVWEVLAATLRARVSDLVAWRPRPLAADAAYLRVDAQAAPAATMAMDRLAVDEPDEIDRLFGR